MYDLGLTTEQAKVLILILLIFLFIITVFIAYSLSFCIIFYLLRRRRGTLLSIEDGLRSPAIAIPSFVIAIPLSIIVFWTSSLYFLHNPMLNTREDFSGYRIESYIQSNDFDALKEHLGKDSSAEDFAVSALLSAARQGNERIVAKLLALGADPQARSERGTTPLHHAAQHGHLEVAEILLWQYGVEVDPQDDSGDTPLHLAAGSSSGVEVEMIAALLEKGANPRAQDNSGRTALHQVASSRGGAAQAIAAARLLLDHGADVNAEMDKGKRDSGPLSYALISAEVEMILFLLEQGAEVHPSHMARAVNHYDPEIVRLFLDPGVYTLPLR